MQLTLPQISQPLKIWEKVEIIIEDKKKRGLYISRIEDFVADCIIIAVPEFMGGQDILKDDCIVTVQIPKDDAVYQFSTRMRSLKSHKSKSYMLFPPVNIQRKQRRQHVRIEFSAQVKFAVIDDSVDSDKFKWQTAKTINLSGGGMLLKASEKIKKGDVLLLKTEIFSKLKIPQPLLGYCCRSFREKNNYFYGVEFVACERVSQYINKKLKKILPESINNFDHKAQEKLVFYIFQEQVELRKKGLI